jgi:tRNA modification GTPase
MDLTAAEAVMDLVQARSERAAVAARAQLAGGLGRAVAACYDDLLGVCAAAEAQLDLEEGESPEWIRDEVMRQAAGVARALDRLLATSREGHLLRAGAMVVIAGCPNAGKSSLLNALLGKERAIVSVHAGTTRDTIEEAMVLDGIPLRVVDTAGLRDVASGVEREGIVRAQNALSYADLILCVIDSSRPLSTQETQLLLRATERNDAPWLGVLNKSDLPRVVTKEEMEGVLRRSGKMLCSEVVSLSLKTRDGMPDVLRAMVRLLGIDNQAPAHASVSGRHRAELMLAQEFLSSAQAQLEYGEERLVLATHEMRRASEALGRIIGKCYTEELLDRIFSRFCVGK